MADQSLPVINMLWIGDALGVIERLSMISFMRQGHQVRLHHYGRVENIPAGVVEADAGVIMPYEQALGWQAHKYGGTFAVAADYFRMRLMQQGAGVWSDCDMVCIKPITIESGVVMGYENDDIINNAILFFDQSSPIPTRIVASFGPNRIPDWFPLARRVRWWRQRLLFQRFGPQDFRWGTFGPSALTSLANEYGVAHLAAPIDVYYPLPWPQWHRLHEPGSSFEEYTTERTKAVHLWRTCHAGERPHAKSAIGRMAANFGL